MEALQLAMYARRVALSSRIDDPRIEYSNGPIRYNGPFLEEVFQTTDVLTLETITDSIGGDRNCGNWLTFAGVLFCAIGFPEIVGSGLTGLSWYTMGENPRKMNFIIPQASE